MVRPPAARVHQAPRDALHLQPAALDSGSGVPGLGSRAEQRCMHAVWHLDPPKSGEQEG